MGESFRWARMVNCDHCGTAHILRDAVFALAGSSGVLHEATGLVHLAQPLVTPLGTFDPKGVVRFSYGRGAWDEFWALDAAGSGVWISVDEGDIVLQRPVAGDLPKDPPSLGSTVAYDAEDWTVTEAETAHCIGFRGHLPEEFHLDEVFSFVNASCGDGRLLSGEFHDGSATWFVGSWLDPFQIGRAR
jgi:hypothetical protein